MNHRFFLSSWILILAGCLFSGVAISDADEKPPFTDYCKRLEQQIQGRKHGFLAGNLTYYVGGFHASWKLVEHETIGLTHPFHHDLRSRGVGLLDSRLEGGEHTGRGNDYAGWEFYKDTRVLHGSVIVDGKLYPHPQPTSMVWRPDRMVCTYEVGGVTIGEQKFIAANDVAASIITSSRPVQLVFSGHSFFHRNSLTSTAEIEYAADHNALLIREGGTVKSRPDPGGMERTGPCVYSGMTTVLGVSRDFSASLKTQRDEKGIQHYKFSVPADSRGTVVTWTMHDEKGIGLDRTGQLLADYQGMLNRKTSETNRQLNEEIPWFRCPDERFVDIYYYLWSLYMMYSIEVGKGWEQENHTQTAVNNFLGIHRYDATFQIRVGSWTRNKPHHAYGNVLTWKHLTQNNRFRETPNGLRLLSDNKGISWHSGAYGGETSEHVLGAWQIYQHTGDVEFIRDCYEDHFEKLFAKRLSVFAMNHFEVAETLQKMAELLGKKEDALKWKSMVRTEPEHIRRMFDQRWEAHGVENFFAAPANGMLMTNGFWAMRSRHFPKEYAKRMVDSWAIDKKKGFHGQFFPLAMARQSMESFNTRVDHSFGYTPDTAYFTLDGMFRQGLTGRAVELTLNHLENYNYHAKWEIPVAPEAYRRDGSLFGDQYSNFNAGKILLYIEGLGGLEYSLPNQEIRIRPALPPQWEWMEFRLPIGDRWTRIRYTKERTLVRGQPFPVTLVENHE